MTTPDGPLVSVIMPVYNGERFLGQAIESILDQSYKQLELIIINNGSTDNTATILETYAQKDRRITILFHPEPLGHAGEAASNLASRHAKGQYIAKLDADDVAVPNRIEKQVTFLEANPTIFLVGSYLELIDSQGNKVGVRRYPLTSEAIYSEFYLRFPVANPAIMYRNGVVAGDFYTLRHKSFTDDYYSLFVHLHNGLLFANLPEPLTLYRVHDSNTVFTNLRKKWMINLGVKKAFVHDFGYHPPWNHRIRIRLITLFINTLPEKMLVKFMNQARQLLNA
ncbi:glycosyltransferase family 2 protein [Spirosoma spitsbergense]|uniref:glycosyltransferase family 2 protein n=1 Tax=Spirosoma spitsbergense TaxID=431554 RepID=UPI0003A44B4D|nr:glycosyltransferase family 2 protein [Spirosoma spitsbergense]